MKGHPTPETLAAFATGTLRAGFDFVTAVHVRGCAHCRAEVARFEALGGALLADAVAAPVGGDALARVMAQLDAPAPPSPPAPSLDELMRAARRRWVAPGVWTAKVNTPHARGDRVYLLSVAAGVTAARHSHNGAEFTQVLSGALEDEGDVYAAGAFMERDPSVTHRPKVLGGEPCICLFATQGRLVPTDLVGRLVFTVADV